MPISIFGTEIVTSDSPIQSFSSVTIKVQTRLIVSPIGKAVGQNGRSYHHRPVAHDALYAILLRPHPRRQYGENNHQIFIKWHDEEIVEPRLTAALHRLLFHPISQRADHAARPAARVGEYGGVKDEKERMEDDG